jgi:hypothetical protein
MAIEDLPRLVDVGGGFHHRGGGKQVSPRALRLAHYR